ncbi:hypothetical protein ElyMa_003498100 [Elysia marginata]|uniref:Uncharacterized protein n=1 Tax=Elysia marginata TaxID=1093978 RepID=A0AAV4EEW3_9GAST|nr:hypothetical protein ElyMa_003498100 [Elysia marginata]
MLQIPSISGPDHSINHQSKRLRCEQGNQKDLSDTKNTISEMLQIPSISRPDHSSNHQSKRLRCEQGNQKDLGDTKESRSPRCYRYLQFLDPIIPLTIKAKDLVFAVNKATRRT